MPRQNLGAFDSASSNRRFAAFFGIQPRVCADVRNLIYQRLPQNTSPKHLLWGLHFLKSYRTKHVLRSVNGVDEKTSRRWIWLIINFESRRRESIEGCFVTIDGTDVPINDPSPFSPMWYSHKLNGAGLRYEIGISVTKGDIVWLHGPFPCGSYNDVHIFRTRLKGLLGVNEKVVADRGYPDPKCVTPYNELSEEKKVSFCFTCST